MNTIAEILRWLVGRWKVLFVLLTPLMLLLGLVEALVEKTVQGIDLLTAAVGAMQAHVTVAGEFAAPWLTKANAFFPISEVLTMCGIWLGIKMLCVIIRIIKAFVPTIA